MPSPPGDAGLAASPTEPGRGERPAAPEAECPPALALLSPEAALLFAPTSPPLGSLAAPFDWESALRLAKREGATAAVQRRIGDLTTGLVPAPVRRRLERAARASRRLDDIVRRQIEDTVAALADRGLLPVLMGGAAAGLTAWPGSSPEGIREVVVLAEAGRHRDAWEVLARSGLWLARMEPGWAPEAPGSLPFLSDPGGLGLRLRVRVDPLPAGHPFRISAGDIWRKALALPLRRRLAYVPGILHQLLLLAVDFAWVRAFTGDVWRTFQGVGALAEHPDLEWERLVELARESRAATCCYWTLKLARSVAGAEVPGDVLRALRPRAPEVLLSALERHHARRLLPPEAAPGAARGLDRLGWTLSVQPRRSGHGRARPWHSRGAAGAGRPSAAPARPAIA